MTKTNSVEMAMVLFGACVLLGIVALAMLAQAQAVMLPVVHHQSSAAAEAIEWTGLGENVAVPPDLAVRQHANKHKEQVLDAWKIYALLLEGQCVASAVFCGPSDIEKLYLCVDPTGRIGGLIVFGEEILTGYQANQDYWTRKTNQPEWEVCRD